MDVRRIREELTIQKESNFKGNIYHFTQVNFAYNSNKIEGSRLSEDETECIFDTRTFFPKKDDLIRVDDLIETINHFKLFDYMLDNIDNMISKDMLIKMHCILKKGTSDEDNPRYNVGGFKVIPNIIGTINVIKTSSPEYVEKDLNNLLLNYTNKHNILLKDIIDFHVKFERIHPFSDGNGRIGRMIMFKECLKNNIIPFIVLDEKKQYYIRGLKEYDSDSMFLIDTILYFQDIYKDLCEKLLDFKLN